MGCYSARKVCIVITGAVMVTVSEHKRVEMIKNIYDMLHQVCSQNKDRIFFVRQNETYADLLRRVKQRAVLLAKRFGIKRGDTVAILSGNTPDFIRSYFAITSQGARVLMLDTGLSTAEHVNMMRRTNCKLALAQREYFIKVFRYGYW